MARIRQFAKDMGLSYNKAKNLVNKGRKLKDGGSSVLESTMNKVKPVMAKNGKYKSKTSPTAKVKKEKLPSVIKGKETPHGSEVPKFMEEYYKKAAEQKKEAGQPGFKVGGSNNSNLYSTTEDKMKKTKKEYKSKVGGSNNSNLYFTTEDKMKETKKEYKSKGGGLAIQGTQFRGVR